MKTIEEVRKDYPYATVMTIGEFINDVTTGNITEYDGVGYFHDGEKETVVQIMFNIDYILSGVGIYPYVCWYNN